MDDIMEVVRKMREAVGTVEMALRKDRDHVENQINLLNDYLQTITGEIADAAKDVQYLDSLQYDADADMNYDRLSTINYNHQLGEDI